VCGNKLVGGVTWNISG